jgi:hypothetical protein
MNYKKILQDKLKQLIKNKKFFYSVSGFILLVSIVAIVLMNQAAINRRAQKEKEALVEKQKTEQMIIQEKKAILNRSTFFLQAPAGARGGMSISNYWEGSYRILDTVGKKMTIIYIKNSAEAPLMYVRYESKANFKLGSGEVELKIDSTNYAYAYYFYPEDSYLGADKENFTSVQKDLKESIKTFSIF